MLQHGPGDSKFDEQGLRDIPEPFWMDMPYANIFACITPDLLHQLHKGVFTDHFVKWSTHGHTAEVNARMAHVPPYHGLHVFKKGISGVQKWTGIKYRQMEKVFVAVLASMRYLDPRIHAAAHDLLDFIYLAHYPAHTTSTLEEMRAALVAFHENKEVFIKLGIREHFNITKLHWLDHYIPSIVNLGSSLAYSTDAPERLHTDYAKKGYRASDRRNYVKQMVNWLTRREKVRYHQTYLRWATARNSDLDSTPLIPPTGLADVEDEYSDEYSSEPECDEPLPVIGEDAMHVDEGTISSRKVPLQVPAQVKSEDIEDDAQLHFSQTKDNVRKWISVVVERC